MKCAIIVRYRWMGSGTTSPRSAICREKKKRTRAFASVQATLHRVGWVQGEMVLGVPCSCLGRGKLGALNGSYIGLDMKSHSLFPHNGKCSGERILELLPLRKHTWWSKLIKRQWAVWNSPTAQCAASSQSWSVCLNTWRQEWTGFIGVC